MDEHIHQAIIDADYALRGRVTACEMILGVVLAHVAARDEAILDQIEGALLNLPEILLEEHTELRKALGKLIFGARSCLVRP